MPDIFIPKNNNKPESVAAMLSSSASRLHPFSSYSEMPQGVHFENQEADETVLLFLRRHFVTNVPWIFTTLILLLLPIVAAPFFTVVNSLILLPDRYFLVIILFYYLLVFTYALVEYITWFYNISLVTQKRIVDIDYSHLVFHDVAITKLSLVEDVNYQQSGFIRSFFNYGDVLVQTAAKHDHFDFLAVPNPIRVIKIIEALIGRRREE